MSRRAMGRNSSGYGFNETDPRRIVGNANPLNAWSDLQKKVRENTIRLTPAKKATPLTKTGHIAAFKRAQSAY